MVEEKGLERAAQGVAPLLDKNVSLKSQVDLAPSLSPFLSICRAVKCKCGKVWCPACGRRRLGKQVADYVAVWDWQRVRVVTLTVDRKQFSGPDQAFDYLQQTKALPNLFRGLVRTVGKGVVDWVRWIEWHKDGYPHWHVLVLVDKPGRAGMLEHSFIRHYWPYGGSREDRIRNERHWQRMTGYMEKHGYMDKGKGHQSVLPQWARDRKTTIRRWGRMHSAGNGAASESLVRSKRNREQERRDWESMDIDERIDRIGDWFDQQADRAADQRTEGDKLDECGCAAEIWAGPFGFNPQHYIGRTAARYDVFVASVHGEWVQGQGFVFDPAKNGVSSEEFFRMILS